MNDSTFAETVDSLNSSLNDCIRDISDIDFLVCELMKKRKSIARRLDHKSSILKKIIKESDIKCFTDDYISSIYESIKDADGVVAIVLNNNTNSEV